MAKLWNLLSLSFGILEGIFIQAHLQDKSLLTTLNLKSQMHKVDACDLCLKIIEIKCLEMYLMYLTKPLKSLKS